MSDVDEAGTAPASVDDVAVMEGAGTEPTERETRADDGRAEAAKEEGTGADEGAEDDSEDEDDGIRRRRRKRAMTLDEEDYELLEDNQVSGFKRKEKKKRLQTAAEREGGAAKPAGTIADLERGLFGDEDDDTAAPAEAGATEAGAEEAKPEAAAKEAERAAFGYSDSEDEMDDFIVRDETDGPRESREERQRRLASGIPGLRRDQLQDAADLFGDTDELHRLFASRARGGGSQEASIEEQEEESDEDEEDEMDDFLERDDATQEDYERARAATAAKKAAKAARKSARKSVGRDDLIYQSFEPSVVKEQMLTASDDAIRTTDLPERHQLKPRPANAPRDWGVEAAWIYDRIMGRDSLQQQPTQAGYTLLYGWLDYESEVAHQQREAAIQAQSNTLPPEEEEEVIKCIAYFLSMTFDENLEMPYIVSQQRDDIMLLLRSSRAEEARPPMTAEGDGYKRVLRRFEILHAVLEWDDRYVRLEVRKARVAGTFAKLASEHGEGELGTIARQCMDLVNDAFLERHVDDAEVKTNLFFTTIDGSKLRRPTRKSQYDNHVKRGIRDLVNMSGPIASTFGEDLKNGISSDLLANLPPEEVAKVYFDQGYANVDEVIQAFVNVAATEIGAEPEVRRWFRDEYWGNAIISTHPTPEGGDVVDPWHPIASVKRLSRMPVYYLTGTQFAQIVEGKRRGLLVVDIGLAKEREQNVLQRMEQAYLSEAQSDLATAWNDVRRRVIRAAYEENLKPSLERETLTQLGLDARDALMNVCADTIWAYMSYAPWRPPNTEEFDTEVRIVAAVSGLPATFVALDTSGELVDFIECHTLGRNIGNGGAQMSNQQDEIQALMDFVVRHRPHMCCVGASGMDSKRVKEALNLVVGRIIEEQPRAIPEEVSEIAVLLVDDGIAKLCETAKEPKAEMPEHQPSILRAVALGRGLLNPAAVVANLVSGGEIASLRMADLQDSVLGKEERVAIVERQLVSLVNQIGVDINMASSHPWMSVLVRYLGGLGPRKATGVLSAVRSLEGGVVDSREQLRASMGDVVFRNAAAFLRVTDADLLDSTRCHPEHYDEAKAIVVNALEIEEQLGSLEHYEQERMLAKVFDPKTWELKVAPLILEEYAEFLQSEEGGSKGKCLEVLREIRAEFRYPFEDLRPAWTPLSAEDEFALLTGETVHTLASGKIIQCTVKKIEGPRDGRGARAVCVLDSGVTGYVEKYDLSDDQYFERIEEKVQPGQVITARVKANGVDVYGFTVQLACASQVLHPNETAQWEAHIHCNPDTNPYYIMDKQPGELRQKKAASKKTKKLKFVPRKIDHPNFQNVDHEEAEKKLETADIGDVIIRPSGKTTKNICATFKTYDGVCAHVIIKETKKSGVANLGLGTPLIIDEEEYEDLDEVMARHIEPIVSHVKHMLKHRKFMRGDKHEIDAALQQQLARNPSVRPYALGVVHPPLNKGAPAFCISFIMSSSGRVHHEPIMAIPTGFRYRKMEFPSVDRLLAYFKVNCSKPPPGREVDNGGWN